MLAKNSIFILNKIEYGVFNLLIEGKREYMSRIQKMGKSKKEFEKQKNNKYIFCGNQNVKNFL